MSKPIVKPKGWFSQFAKIAACWTGTPAAFCIAVATIVIWAVTGPIFQFNDTWQLVINTGTTIVTFFDGISNSKCAEPRLDCFADQVG